MRKSRCFKRRLDSSGVGLASVRPNRHSELTYSSSVAAANTTAPRIACHYSLTANPLLPGSRTTLNTRTPIALFANSFCKAAKSDMAHTTYPSSIPAPTDDGAAAHLTGLALPDVALPPTSNPSNPLLLSSLKGLTVLFFYPRTAAPDETVPDDWNSIPGARGCTPQACSFRDNLSSLKSLGVENVYGVSVQSTAYQAELKERVHLPYDLLSDERLELQRAMDLPVFEWKGSKLLKRLAMVVDGGRIEKVWYPVFPPDKNVDDVIEYLKAR